MVEIVKKRGRPKKVLSESKNKKSPNKKAVKVKSESGSENRVDLLNVVDDIELDNLVMEDIGFDGVIVDDVEQIELDWKLSELNIDRVIAIKKPKSLSYMGKAKSLKEKKKKVYPSQVLEKHDEYVEILSSLKGGYLRETMVESTNGAPITEKHFMARLGYINGNTQTTYHRSYMKNTLSVGNNKNYRYYRKLSDGMFANYVQFHNKKHFSYESMVCIDIDNADLTYLSYLFHEVGLTPNIIVRSLTNENSLHCYYVLDDFDRYVYGKTVEERGNIPNKLKQRHKISHYLTLLLNGDVSALAHCCGKNPLAEKWRHTSLFTGKPAYNGTELLRKIRLFVNKLPDKFKHTLNCHFKLSSKRVYRKFEKPALLAFKDMKKKNNGFRSHVNGQEKMLNYASFSSKSRNCRLHAHLLMKAHDYVNADERQDYAGLFDYLFDYAIKNQEELLRSFGLLYKGKLSSNEISNICRSLTRFYDDKKYQYKRNYEKQNENIRHKGRYDKRNEKASKIKQEKYAEFCRDKTITDLVLNKKKMSNDLCYEWSKKLGLAKETVTEYLKFYRKEMNIPMMNPKDKHTNTIVGSKEFFDYYFNINFQETMNEFIDYINEKVLDMDDEVLTEANGEILIKGALSDLAEKIDGIFYVVLEDGSRYENAFFYEFVNKFYRYELKVKEEEFKDKQLLKEFNQQEQQRVKNHQAITGFPLSYVDAKTAIKTQMAHGLSQFKLPNKLQNEFKQLNSIQKYKENICSINDLPFMILENASNFFLNDLIELAQKNKIDKNIVLQKYEINDILNWSESNPNMIKMMMKSCAKYVRSKFYYLKQIIKKIHDREHDRKNE